MDGTATSKVKRTELVEPAVGLETVNMISTCRSRTKRRNTCIPGPVRNWTVTNCTPTKAKDERWKYTAAFKRSANDDHSRTSCEHEFVEGEDDIRDDGSAPRGGD